ncbi:FadR/GntR family transcriptional regulator [Blastococcus sp. SYSU D00813]
MTSLFLQMRRVTLAEVVDCWMALEPTVVRLAAQRRGSAQLAALAPQLADVPLEEDTAFLEVARQLHHAVLRAAGNSLVELLVDALAQLIVDRIGRFLLPVDQRAAWMCDLQGLLAAVLAGRPEQAEAHLAHLLRRLRAHLDHRPTVLEQPIVWR